MVKAKPYHFELAKKVKTIKARFAEKRRSIFLSVLGFLLVLIIFYPQRFMDVWLTQDQQGRLWFSQQDYAKAAESFIELNWQAYSYYIAEEFELAAQVYGQIDSEEARFAQANALAHGRHYVKARAIYQALLLSSPAHQGAVKNLQQIEVIIAEIDGVSKKQVAEQGEMSQELGDAPQTSDGVERQDMQSAPQQQLTSEQLLQDPKLIDMWLRQVQKDPSRFLSAKFLYQYEQQLTQSEGSK